MPYLRCLGSHSQRLLLAVGFSLPITHDHRKLRGERGYQYRDIKGGSLNYLISPMFCHGQRQRYPRTAQMLAAGPTVETMQPYKDFPGFWVLNRWIKPLRYCAEECRDSLESAALSCSSAFSYA